MIIFDAHFLSYFMDASEEVKCSEEAQSCPTLCDPLDCSLPRSSIHGIFQARVLEWVATAFSRGSSWPRDQTQVSHTPTVWATDARTPNKWKKLTTWWPWMLSPQTYWLRIDNVKPCDTTLLSHNQPVRELYTNWPYTVGCPTSPGL